MRKFDKDKYLKKLKFNKYKRYVYIGLPCLLVLLVGIYFAYSKFSVSKDAEVVRTTVGDFIYGDIVITPYLDGEYSKEFPKEEVGINVEKVTCDNDAVGEWDEDNWRLKVTNLTKRTKCNVYFVTPKSCDISDNVSCINSREELATLATEVNNGDNKSGKIIYLTSDLDLGGKFDSDGNALDGNISWTPIGTDNPFSGTFDGNGHIISNMYINRQSNSNNGLFGSATNGVIKNLGIESSYVLGNIGQGGIVGISGSIFNCFSDTIVKGNAQTGGICGAGCNTRNSYNRGKVINGTGDITGGIQGGWGAIHNSYNYGSVSSDGHSVGGIMGWSGSVYSSYNLGDINNGSGILGAATEDSSIVKNFNSGKITGGGGIVTYEYDKYSVDDFKNLSMIIKNNYYLKDSSTYGLFAYKSNYNSEPLSQDEMPSVISVINGDNAFVEDTNNINNGYPILKWQQERSN